MAIKPEIIKELANGVFDEIVGIRKHLHQYPELSFEEEKTGQFILDKLTSWGIEAEGGWANHGVVGMIGKKDGPVIGLRADIDALPIQEENDCDYASKNEGIMHACGHDVHTSCLLGAAYILKQLEDELPGRIKLIFQPAEEKLPGGASILIKEGVLENPKVDAMLGLHVFPEMEVGHFGFKPGMYMASADEIHATIRGKGGHGAMPHNCTDPILMASHLIVALQQIVSRHSNPTIPSVLTIGKIASVGGATNVIPDEVKIAGTFRTLDEEWRSKAHAAMTTMAEQLIASMGGEISFEVTKGYPYLSNDEALTNGCFQWAQEYIGEASVAKLPIRMTGEDFAFYTHHVPACFYRLGVTNTAKGINARVHTPHFDIDHEALRYGAGMMTHLALRAMEEKY